MWRGKGPHRAQHTRNLRNGPDLQTRTDSMAKLQMISQVCVFPNFETIATTHAYKLTAHALCWRCRTKPPPLHATCWHASNQCIPLHISWGQSNSTCTAWNSRIPLDHFGNTLCKYGQNTQPTNLKTAAKGLIIPMLTIELSFKRTTNR